MRIAHKAKTFSVLLAALLACGAMVMNLVTWDKVHQSIGKHQRAVDIKMEWEKLISSVKNAETGERGFLLTGDEDYLTPLHDSKRALSESIARLRLLDPLDQKYIQSLDEIRELMRARLDLAVEKITVRRREGLEAAIAMVKTNQGKEMTQMIREKVSMQINDQQEIINERTRVMQHDLRWGYYSVITTFIIALLVGGLAIYHLRESALQDQREERLTKGKLRAELSERQKSSFLANMSHEIRTPMNAILGFSELLDAEATTEKQKRYTESILVGGRALLHLINDILDLSKIEAGMMPVKPEPTEVREIGSLLQQLFSQEAAKKNLSFRIEVPESMPHSLLIDAGKLRQILINVVNNALKFTTHGHVLVRFAYEAAPARTNRMHLRIEVEDSGGGISADQQKHFFSPFVQTGKSPVGEQRGTGLGLAIVSRFVELMGGTILLKSEVGVGTTIRFDFPGVEVSARLPQILTPADRVVDFNNLRPSTLLVADDNETNRELVKCIFENTHHRVLLACDGASAVQAVVDEKPDLVLMDIQMPDMDGHEALLAIRSHPECAILPVLAVTASCLDEEESELRRKFDGYIRKPFTRAELYREITLFVPKHDVEGSVSSPMAVDPQALSPDLLRRWQDLAVCLRELEREVWPGARDGMVMSEVTRFATGLREMAVDAQCPMLEDYASHLCADAEAFSIASLEQGLAEFPLRISEIERCGAFPNHESSHL